MLQKNLRLDRRAVVGASIVLQLDTDLVEKVRTETLVRLSDVPLRDAIMPFSASIQQRSQAHYADRFQRPRHLFTEFGPRCQTLPLTRVHLFKAMLQPNIKTMQQTQTRVFGRAVHADVANRFITETCPTLN